MRQDYLGFVLVTPFRTDSPSKPQSMPQKSDKLDRILDAFARKFEREGLQLPDEAVVGRSRGVIKERGWTVQYLFGSDELGNYLDYYAVHRMTNDRHVRIREDGSVEALPSFIEMYVISDDPLEAKRLENEYFAHNKSIAQLLHGKGFGLDLNAKLRSGAMRDE